LTKFKTLGELEKFKDTSMWCLCGRLMTGLHMQNCNKLRKKETELKKKELGLTSEELND